MSTLSDKALELAKLELATGVRGNVMPGWGRFRGPRVDEYQRSVGLPVPPNPQLQGWPWCASAVYWLFQQAAEQLGIPNPCPRTGSALHMWSQAPDGCQTNQAAPGCVFVLDRGSGHGHVGFVESVANGGVLYTVEPDTANRTMSATGDAWGEHEWDPTDGKRGVLLGYLAF